MFNFIWYTIPLLRGLIDKKSSQEREQRQLSRSTDENIRLQETIHEMRTKEERHKAHVQADIVRLQGDVDLQNTIAEDLHRRFEDASPFLLPLRSVWPMLFSEYTEQGLPLLLIAPFWDETQANVANDAGGAQFRVAMADALRDSPWGGNFNVLDGYFKRPLRQTDMDLRIINDALKDIPVAVVFGTLDQHEIRAEIALWNILPGETPGRRVYIRGKGRMPRDVVIKDNREFKQELGRDLAHAIGQVGAIHELFRSGSQPDVQSFATGDEVRDREVTARFEEYECLYDLYHTVADRTDSELQHASDVLQGFASRRIFAAIPTGRASSCTVSTLAGTGNEGFLDGEGTSAKFNWPNNVAVDKAGNVYVTDVGNDSIRKITPAGVVSTLAGTGKPGFTNGYCADARFQGPHGIAVDSADVVYVADTYNSTIRKITAAGIVSNLAGTKRKGFVNGPVIYAKFNEPTGVAVDDLGMVYVADLDNHSIRKITPAGVVSTFAGTGTIGFTNGPGSQATFHFPYGIAVDSGGNVYVADARNHAIRKITKAGVASTLAGTGQPGFSNGPGHKATFHRPHGVAVDEVGNVYVADVDNHSIRRITPGGNVSTLAGTGQPGLSNGPGTNAKFNEPISVTVDAAGHLYVADAGNRVIRKITVA